MSIKKALDKACEAQIARMFESFVNSVAGAKDKEKELIAAAARFKTGADVVKRVLAKAKEIAG